MPPSKVIVLIIAHFQETGSSIIPLSFDFYMTVSMFLKTKESGISKKANTDKAPAVSYIPMVCPLEAKDSYI